MSNFLFKVGNIIYINDAGNPVYVGGRMTTTKNGRISLFKVKGIKYIFRITKLKH